MARYHFFSADKVWKQAVKTRLNDMFIEIYAIISAALDTSESAVLYALGATKDEYGNLTFANGILSKKVGLFTYNSAPTPVTVTEAGTYYSYSGNFTRRVLEGLSVVGTDIQYDGDITQYLKVSWYITLASDTNNNSVGVGVSNNGTMDTTTVMTSYAKWATEPTFISGTAVFEMAPGDSVGAYLTSNIAGSVVTIINGTFTIDELFD